MIVESGKSPDSGGQTVQLETQRSVLRSCGEPFFSRKPQPLPLMNSTNWLRLETESKQVANDSIDHGYVTKHQ